MSFRFLLHIPGGVVKAALYAFLIGLVLFFALTRTQVGRDSLRREIERQFDQTFAGSLRIGQLQGNLVSTLYARDIDLLDPDGQPVLSVESAVVRASWYALFRRTVSLYSITLIRPDISLVYEADRAWNLERVFHRMSNDPSLPWSFSSAELRIIDGRVLTSNEGVAPPAVEAGRVFDYSRSLATGIQAGGTIEWNPDYRLIDIQHLSGTLPEQDIVLDDLLGQLFIEDGQFALNQVVLRSGDTYLDLNAIVRRDAGLPPDTAGWANLELELNESRIDQGTVHTLFPFLPVADTVRVAARVSGPLSELTVRDVLLARGVSSIRANGSIRGFPDSLAFDLSVTDGRLLRNDVQALLPQTPLPALPLLGPVAFDLEAAGVVDLSAAPSERPFDVRMDLDAGSAGGRVQGQVAFARGPGTLPTYSAALDIDSLDVSRFRMAYGPRSRLAARLIVDGSGLTPEVASVDAHLDLGPSEYDGRRVDTLHADLALADRVVRGNGFARHAETGTLFARARYDLEPPLPVLDLDLTARRLDVGPLLLVEPLQTDLNAAFALHGSGRTWSDIRGEARLAFDSSSVRLGDTLRTLPPHASRLTLSETPSGRRNLSLEGDVMTAHVESEALLRPLYALGRLWGAALHDAARQAIDKPRALSALTAPDSLVDATQSEKALRETIATYYLANLRQHAQTLLDASHPDAPASVDADVHILRADILSALLPMLPPLATNLQATLHVDADADVLALDGYLDADSLLLGALRMHAPRGSVQVAARLDAPLLESLTTRLDLTADSVTAARQFFRAPDVAFSYANRSAHLSTTTAGGYRTGPQRLTADIELLPDRNQVRLSDLQFSIGRDRWAIAEQEPMDVYADAVVFPGLLLESHSQADTRQTLRVEGVLSTLPGDTAFVELDRFVLREFSEFLRLNLPVGGLLEGQVALTGFGQQPTLTGRLDVTALSLDTRVLGDLTLESRFLPGQPNVGLQVSLTPTVSDSSALDAGRPPPAQVLDNRLLVDGTFRLPKLNAQRTGFRDAGALNLTARLDRADLFFFEYIFPNTLTAVSGYLAGTGTITGDFQVPLFNADLDVADGQVAITKFGLRYESFQGPVTVDAGGIRLQEATFRDPTGGTGTVSGSILFNDYRYFSFDLGAQLNALQIMNVEQSEELPFYGHIWASGTLDLDGPASNAMLRSDNATTTPESELYIPATEDELNPDAGFIIFADSLGRIPDLKALTYRPNLLAERPEGERRFVEGLNMSLNIFAPPGSTIHLVFDPLLGEVINAVGSGRVQIQRREGEFRTYGTLNIDSGDYLFTAGDVFARRFVIDAGGTITWDGDPIDARLEIPASYRTRASRAGLPGQDGRDTGLIPLIVRLDISGHVSSPLVDLSLAYDRSDRDFVGKYEGLEAALNQPDRAAEFATSVLLTNSFLLTTDDVGGSTALTNSGNQLAFNSVSQLVASQLNRFLRNALPNVDLNLGLQGESLQDPDLTYGVALYLLDERLVIRGQGVYQNEITQNQAGLEGEFVVEVRLNSNVSVQVFLRREGDVLAENALTSTRGAGLSYQTQFSSWQRLFKRLFGWLGSDDEAPEASDEHVASRPGPDS